MTLSSPMDNMEHLPVKVSYLAMQSPALPLTLSFAGVPASPLRHPDRAGEAPTNSNAQAIFPPQACVFVAKYDPSLLLRILLTYISQSCPNKI